MQNDKTALIDAVKSLYRLYLNAVRFPAEFYPRRFQWTPEEYEEERPELNEAKHVYRKNRAVVDGARKELLRVAFQDGFPVPDPWLTVRFYGTSPWPVRFFRADGETFISDADGKPCRAKPGQTMVEWTDTGPDFPALATVMQEMKLAIMRLEAENQPEPGPTEIADPPAPATAAGNGATDAEMSLEARALAVLVDHPDWNDSKIARAVRCNRTSLYRLDRFQAAKEQLRRTRQDRPRGSKGADGTMEAWNRCDG